ncbi:MAG: DUF3634 family protein [Polyangiaceae bacterium]
MGLLYGLLILALLAIPFAWSLYRSNELFYLQVRRGRTQVLRGKLPQSLANELADVMRRAKVRRANVRVVQEDRAPAIKVVDGELSDGTLQQMRNVLGRYDLAQIKAGGRVR